jgi:hypothetical protein
MRAPVQIALALSVVGASAVAALAVPTTSFPNADLGAANATVTHSWRATGIGSGKTSFVVDYGGCSFYQYGNESSGSMYMQVHRFDDRNQTRFVSMYLPAAKISKRSARGSVSSTNKRVAELIRQGYIRDAQYTVDNLRELQPLTETARYHPLVGNVTVQRVAGSLTSSMVGKTNTLNVTGSFSYRGTVEPYPMAKPASVSGSYKIKARKAPINT